MLGGRIENTFDATALDPRGLDLAGILEGDRESRRRVQVDFSRLQ